MSSVALCSSVVEHYHTGGDPDKRLAARAKFSERARRSDETGSLYRLAAARAFITRQIGATETSE